MNKPALPLIQLDGVSKRYRLYPSALRQMLGYLGVGSRSVPSKLALDNVSLQIAKGERVGIVGHNGSGKTTLLRLISGYTRATSGSLSVRGEVQALMQTGYGFNNDLTGLENIRNALVYNGLSAADAAAAEQDIVDFVELGEFLNHPLKTYSLGMRTRLEFAAATAISPDVLAIDEVLGAGDGYFVRKCAQRMRGLMSNTTLLLVSHSLDQIREYCDRVIWMDGGTIRADGPMAETLDQYRQYMQSQSERRLNDGATRTVSTAQPPSSLMEKILALFGLEPSGASCARAFHFADGSNAKVLEIGAPLSLQLSMDVPPGHHPVLLGFSDQGAYVFELEFAPPSSEGNMMNLHAPRFGVGVGNYVLFPALRCENGRRIVQVDNLPLTLHMARANWSDPPLVHFDGQWRAGAAGAPIASKVSGWV